jgi:hypothetical protein
MNTRKSAPFAAVGKLRMRGIAGVMGADQALRFARSGMFISAIKYIESANPRFSRETAKAIVRSFGYDHESRSSESERWPEQSKMPVRCL